MCIEILDFFFESHLDWHSVDDIFLSPVDNTDVSKFQMDLLVHQHLLGGCSLVHDVDLGYDTDRSFSVLVPVPGEFQAVRNCHILVGRNHTKNDGLGVLAVSSRHSGGDLLDIFLPFHVDSGDAWQVDDCQIGTIVRVDSELDGVINNVTALSCHLVS